MPDKETKGKPIAMSVGFPVFDGTTPVFANQMTVQHTGTEYVISFYAAFPPMLTGTSEEQRKKAEDIAEIPPTCVARVVVTPDRMPEMLAALANNVRRAQPDKVSFQVVEGPKKDGKDG